MSAICPVFSSDKTYGVYIHIPFCKSKCKYCAFVSVPDLSLQNKYVDALCNEIEKFEPTVQRIMIDTVYIGGGTPSCLFCGGIEKILKYIKNRFDTVENAEITAEANPESVDERFIEECVESGVTRISMGFQSANDRVLKNVGRLHSESDFYGAIRCVKRGGIDNISSDIILGLPGQDISDVKKSIDMLSADCKHISVYALSVEEGTPLYNEGYRPDDDLLADMYDFAREYLGEKGFSRYEVSNFAKDADHVSKHNIKYWNGSPYIGFGAAAHGYDGENIRYFHTDDIKDYITGAPLGYTVLRKKDRYNEALMLSLRTETGFCIESFEKKFGDFIREKASAFDRLFSLGAIIKENGFLKIAKDKFFVMNEIISDLMI